MVAHYLNIKDFDGDELNFSILLDNDMAEEYMTLSPHYNITDITKPYSVSGNLTLLSPATSTLSNYLSRTDIGEQETDEFFDVFETVDMVI